MIAFSRQSAPVGLFSPKARWLSVPNRIEIRALRSRALSTVASPMRALTVSWMSSNAFAMRSAAGP
jgi:hypothetical protein